MAVEAKTAKLNTSQQDRPLHRVEVTGHWGPMDKFIHGLVMQIHNSEHDNQDNSILYRKLNECRQNFIAYD